MVKLKSLKSKLIIQCFVKTASDVRWEFGNWLKFQLKLSSKDCPVMLWSEESGGPFYIDTVYCCKKCHKERRKEKAKNKRLAEIKKLTA